MKDAYTIFITAIILLVVSFGLAWGESMGSARKEREKPWIWTQSSNELRVIYDGQKFLTFICENGFKPEVVKIPEMGFGVITYTKEGKIICPK